jgi:molecular chaperone DnaK
MNATKKTNRVAAGIDLGTTFSVVAYCDGQSAPRVLANSVGKQATPSVVCFKKGEILVGQEAKDEQEFGNPNVASFFKRHMGDSTFAFSDGSKSYSATELSAFLLKKLKEDAEAQLGKKITDAIITVPAYFNHFQREATLAAARDAGLNPLRAINEPTAAALAFGIRASESTAGKKYLVYDLGGGTFDVSIIAIDAEEIRVLATEGDHLLGGKDWDDRILRYVADRFRDETGLDLFADVETLNEALVRAERAKTELSARVETKITVASQGQKVSAPITRALFEELSSDLFERTSDLCTAALRSCSPPLTWNDLEGIILVGGSTRMPAVAEFMEAKSGKPVLTGVNVDEAVALGAALQASADLAAEDPQYELESAERRRRLKMSESHLVRMQESYLWRMPQLADVCSHTLGMIAENDDRSKYVNSAILKKNSPIPSQDTKRHKLNVGVAENPELEVYLLQGEHERPLDNVVLGKYVFSGFETGGAKEIQVDVTYSYDRNGVVDVAAAQVGSARSLTRRVEPVPDDMSWTDGAPKDLTTKFTGNLSIVFVVDVSTSMFGRAINKARASFLSFIEKFDLKTTKIGVVRFSDKSQIVQKPTNSMKLLKRAASKIRIAPFRLGIANAAVPLDDALRCFPEPRVKVDRSSLVKYSSKKLRDLAFARSSSDDRRFIVVLTDGRWLWRDRAVKQAKLCAAQGIDIVAIGFGAADKRFLEEISTLDEGALFTDLSRLEESFSTIAQTIKGIE